jgi:hypothetical protein
MMLFFFPAFIQDRNTHHASPKQSGIETLFTLNVTYLQAKPYYLSSLGNGYLPPYYLIV